MVFEYFIHIFLYLLVIGLVDAIMIFLITSEAESDSKFCRNLLRCIILVGCYYILNGFYICAFTPHECFYVNRGIVDNKEKIVYYNTFQTDSTVVYVNRTDTLKIVRFDKFKEGEESVRVNMTCSDGYVMEDVRLRKDRYNNSRNKYAVIKTYWPKVDYELVYFVD